MEKYSVDWTSAHQKNFNQLLHHLKGCENLNFLEIGVWEGRTSKWLLDTILTHPTSTLHAIDIEPKEHFYSNLSEALKQQKVRLTCSKSFDQLQRYYLSGQKFDFIYVDGCHLMKNVLEDVMLSFHLLNIGGIMLMDDYPWDNYAYLDSLYHLDALPLADRYSNLTPKHAIDAFLLAYAHEIEVLIMDYQVGIRKKESFEKQYSRSVPIDYQF